MSKFYFSSTIVDSDAQQHALLAITSAPTQRAGMIKALQEQRGLTVLSIRELQGEERAEVERTAESAKQSAADLMKKLRKRPARTAQAAT